MLNYLPTLPTLKAFETVARRRSFVLAASELNLTASAISHQIARLEENLGVKLFERNAHGVKLSVAGERYLSRIGGALNAISSASDDLRQGVNNALYLHASPSLASLWLMPRLADFQAKHPDISLYLSAAHTPSDFALGQADIDIRYGIPIWQGLEVMPLFKEKITPLASPQFIEKHKLKRKEQLLTVPLIQSAVSVVQWSDWFHAFTKFTAPERFSLRFDRAQLALDAAVQGLGVALESTIIASSHITNHHLKPVFSIENAKDVEAHFLVCPAKHLKREPVAAFISWIKTVTSRK